MARSERLRAFLLSLLILLVFLAAWQIGTQPVGGGAVVDDDYAKLVGAAAASGQKSAFPTPADFGAKLIEQLSHPFTPTGRTTRESAFSLPGRSAASRSGFSWRPWSRFRSDF